jgi:hypothetical protein
MKSQSNWERMKQFWQKTANKATEWWQWFNEKTQCDGNPMSNAQPLYPNCMNCGTELKGMYCHKCGQYASAPLNLSQLIKEYIKNILVIERQALPTLCSLIFQPGRLAQEFCAGRYMSYLHPLKLHLFILIVLFALFAFFGTDEKVKGSLTELANNNTFISELTLVGIQDNKDYMAEMIASPRDTATIVAPHATINNHPEMFDVVNVVSLSGEEDALDTLVVVMPELLVSDSLMYEHEGVLHFSPENKVINNAMMFPKLTEAWSKLTSLIFGHFPLLILLTTPLLITAIQIILRRKNRSRIFTSIFSLYYLTFMELLFSVLYIAGIIFKFGYSDVRWLVISILLIYLTVALKRAYNIVSWVKAALAATVINVCYFAVCIFLISFISICIVIASLV